ncbi:MAG: isochorismatase family protein [Alphaproteobacteria bacterium]|nr:isochorismatase family protein [Alphaproteobacteria bacterium]MCB1839551.1 isochorismatase family protein [Alphaproteobacteria bacterium]
MAEQAPRDKMVVVLVIDMQDGMWKNAPPEPGEKVERSELFDRIALHREEKRKTGMDALAADIQPFVDEMRDNGAMIVWVKMKSDDVMQYGDLYKLTPDPVDSELWKDAQWVYPGNETFFEALRDEAEARNQDLEIKVCGVWALECVINSHVTLHKAGYHSRIVGDLTIDSAKPSQDDDRPNNNEAHALYQASLATGIKKPAQWKDDILREQRAIFARRQAPSSVEPVGDEPGF